MCRKGIRARVPLCCTGVPLLAVLLVTGEAAGGAAVAVAVGQALQSLGAGHVLGLDVPGCRDRVAAEAAGVAGAEPLDEGVALLPVPRCAVDPRCGSDGPRHLSRLVLEAVVDHVVNGVMRLADGAVVGLRAVVPRAVSRCGAT